LFGYLILVVPLLAGMGVPVYKITESLINAVFHLLVVHIDFDYWCSQCAKAIVL
jgi:hypothetical protein